MSGSLVRKMHSSHVSLHLVQLTYDTSPTKKNCLSIRNKAFPTKTHEDTTKQSTFKKEEPSV